MTDTPLPTRTRGAQLEPLSPPVRRPRPWPNFLLALAGGGAIVAAVLLVGPSASSSGVEYRYVTVQRGVVQTSESASGNLAPVSESDLNFKASGILTNLYVSAGQHVAAGQLLAEIDPTSAQVALEESKANLEAAQAKLAETEANPSGSTPSSSGAANASAASLHASVAFGGTGTSGATGSSGSSGSSGSTGTSGASTTTKPKSSSGKTSSTGKSSSTTSSNDSAATKATDQANIASAQAAVSSDALTVKTDETALAGTKLYAPTAGTIASISGAVGDEVTAGSGSSGSGSSGSGSSGSGATSSFAGTSSSSSANDSSSDSSSSSGSGFIVLADLSAMQLVVSVSEADIGSIKVGQPATVTIDALPGEEFAAKVTSISVLSTNTSGVVSYDVTLELTQNSSRLRPGMSATATIISGQVNNALNVESAAISSAGSTSTVEAVKSGKLVVTPVITGLVGTSATQIVAGLSAGEEVAIRISTSIATATGTSSSTATGTLGGGLAGGGFAGGGLGGGGGGRFTRGR
jgi:macrolide-specific efflux system membrane fusion protein